MMKKTFSVVWILFAIAVSAAAQRPSVVAAKNSWKEFVYEKENFKVKLPSPPQESLETVETEIGRVPIRNFVTSAPPNVFTVLVAEYPLSFDTAEAAKGVIETGIGAMTAKMKLESTEQKEITFGKYPGREVRAKVLDGVMTVRGYVVNHRMYLLIVVSDGVLLKSPQSNEVRQFFESFGFVKSPETESSAAPPVSGIDSAANVSSGPPPSFYTQPVLWRNFSQPECGFTVRMPGEPYKETVTLNPNDPRLNTQIWMAKGEGGLVYQIAFQQLLAVPKDDYGLKVLLENLRNGVAEGIKAKIISERQITLDGNPGREFNMRSDQFRAIGRIYLVGSGVYMLNVLNAAGEVSQQDVAGFFDSLTITKIPNAISAKAGAVVETAVWKEAAEPSFGYSVSLPSEPKKNLLNNAGFDMNLMVANGDGVLCLTGHMFLPEEPPSKKDQADFLSAFGQSFAEGMKATVVGEKEITFDGYPGREFKLKNDLVSGVSRVYLVNSHLYLFLTMPTITDSSGKAMTRFLDSFKLVEIKNPPPPPPPPPPAKSVTSQQDGPQNPKRIKVSGGVLQGNAIKKVQPEYPQSAKQNQVQGEVRVQVLISESGNVIEATVISGAEELKEVSVKAARQWLFKPTALSGEPVQVQGVLTFNFILQ